MWSLIATALGWLLSLLKPKDSTRKVDFEAGAAAQRDVDRGADSEIIQKAQRAAKDANTLDPRDDLDR